MFIATLSLLGYCLLIRRFLRWPIEAAPFFIISFTIVLFYLFAYCGILYIGSLIFICLGSLALLATPFYLPRNDLLENYFTPGFCIFIFYILLFGSLTHYLIATDWDELAKWLPHAKLIYLRHGFWQAMDTAQDKDYPPGGALFYYLFLRLGKFSEWQLYFAQLFLLLSPLIILFRKYQWSEAFKAFISFFITLIFLISLFEVRIGVIGNLMMDSVAGLFFGGILVNYYMRNKEPALWCYLLFPAAALVLFKPMLLPFIVTITAVIFCDQLYLIKKQQTKLSSLFLYTCMGIVAVLFLISWQHYTSKYLQMSSQWNLDNLYLAMQKIFSLSGVNKLNISISTNLNSLVTPLLFVLGIILVVTWTYQKISDSVIKQRVIISQMILLLGYIIYVCLLVVIYTFQMKPEVAATFESFGRFMSIYYSGWFLVVLAQWLYLTDNFILLTVNFSKKLQYIILGSIVISFSVYANIYWQQKHSEFAARKNEEYLRYAVTQFTNPVRQLVNEKSKIMVLWSGDVLMGYIINDELLPIKNYLSNGNFATANEFAKHVKQYNYLLIGHVDTNFWHHYQSYFLNNTQHPLTTITLCANKNFSHFNREGCVFQEIPIYLYKVILREGRVKLVSVHSIAVSSRASLRVEGSRSFF